MQIDLLCLNFVVSYCPCSMEVAAEEPANGRPKAAVQNDSNMHRQMNAMPSHAVNCFNTSAVDVPKTDSAASPPKEAPNPELLLS